MSDQVAECLGAVIGALPAPDEVRLSLARDFINKESVMEDHDLVGGLRHLSVVHRLDVAIRAVVPIDDP